MRLENKVAIVTGGAKGLGGEMAQLFAKEGAKVIAADMIPLSYEAENVEYYQLNVADGAACEALFNYAKEKYGRIDVLVADSVPAKAIMQPQAGLKIVYEGMLYTGPINIVLPNGDTALQAEINRIIKVLQGEGFIDALAQKYFCE